MRDLVESGKRSFLIRDLALRIVRRANVQSRDFHGELSALFKWVQGSIRFTKDPFGVEYIQSPQQLLETLAGDCEDMSTLLAALSESIGHKTEFKVTSNSVFRSMNHIYPQVRLGGSVVVMDASVDMPIGWETPGIKRSKLYRRSY
jgi:transglutaminase-like putative cysteine protease